MPLFIFLLCFFPLQALAELESTGERELSLEDSIRTALKTNLNLQLVQEDIELAAGSKTQASGKFDIVFAAKASLKREELTPLIPGGAELEDSGLWSVEGRKLFATGTAISLGWQNTSFDSDSEALLFESSYNSGLLLDIRQPLLQGFGQDVQTAIVKASEKQLEAASFLLDSEAANLAAKVKKAYWQLVFAWQDIEVKRLSLELSKQLLSETQTRISAGKLAPVEIFQPQSEVARRQEQLISAERAIGVAEDNLKLLLNSNEWLVAYHPIDTPKVATVELDLPKILNNALQNRPDIKAAELKTQAAELNLRTSDDRVRPDLSLVGRAGVGATMDDYPNTIDRSLRDPDTIWQLGVEFSVPIENRAAKGEQQRARARLSKAKTSTMLLRQEVKRSVRTTVRDVRLALKALEATRKTSLATRKRLEAEQVKFESGRSTTLDVLTAQEAYSRALSQENLTKITYANILAELDRIQGLVTFSSAR